MNKRQLGAEWEHKAAEFLCEKGYHILEQNYRCRFGEIDIIASDKDELVFIEVKYRKDLIYGSPFDAITMSKQRTIKKTAQYYLLSLKQSANVCCRFDVVGITGDAIELIKNAF